jgi:hypothetical protein
MIPPTESDCPENTIGEFCVPCEWIYESCERVKICDNDKCVCSSGYYMYEYNWNQDCYYCKVTHVYTVLRRSTPTFLACGVTGRYGHGCKKSCGKCNFNYYSACNNIDGTCSSCADGFSGPRCDIRM